MVLTPLASPDSPLLPSPVWLEAMPVLADMLPTLLESFTSPRGLLMLRPSLRLSPPSSTVPTDIPMLVSMVDTAPMVPTPLPTDMPPMVPTPTPTPVSMVDTEPMVPMVLPMEPTPIPTDTPMPV